MVTSQTQESKWTLKKLDKTADSHKMVVKVVVLVTRADTPGLEQNGDRLLVTR